MAFFNRVGSLLKQTVSKHVTSELPRPNASLFQAIRSMSSSSKLFIGGLSYTTDEMSLREAFSQYGEVVEARVILDRETGRSRGFAFVTFTSTEAASSAIQAFDGQDLHGRRVRVNYATEKPRGGGFGGGGYGGGGFGGGGYGGGGFGGGGYGGGGGQGGNYGQGGYQGGDGDYSGGGRFGSGNQYPSGGGGYGGNNYTGGGSGGFDGTEHFPVAGGIYEVSDPVQDDTRPKYTGERIGFADLLNDSTGATGESQESLGGPRDDAEAGNKDFGQGNSREEDDDDEPNDYANTRS